MQQTSQSCGSAKDAAIIIIADRWPTDGVGPMSLLIKTPLNCVVGLGLYGSSVLSKSVS